MCIWKAWKRPKTRVKNLIECGIKPYWARIYGNSSKGYWANAEGSRRRAGARVRGGIFGGYFGGDYGLGIFLTRDDLKRCGDHFVFGYFLLEDLTSKSSSIGFQPLLYMPKGSAPIIPRGSAFRICLFHTQIHGSRRRAGARVRGGIFGWYWSWDFLDERRRVALLGPRRIRGLSF